MALESLGELLEVAGRFVLKMLNEVLIEFLCKGTGYLICKRFNRQIDPDGFMVFVVGAMFWLVLIISAYQLYVFIEADACLDSGGHYDQIANQCIS